MPCPLFIPSRAIREFDAGATPLGDLFTGNCAADPQYRIPEDLLRTGCNFGYARNACAFAQRSEADATCFIISRIEPHEIEVRWSLERDHLPVAVGELNIDLQGAGAADPLQAQAQAYVSVYRHRLT